MYVHTLCLEGVEGGKTAVRMYCMRKEESKEEREEGREGGRKERRKKGREKGRKEK